MYKKDQSFSTFVIFLLISILVFVLLRLNFLSPSVSLFENSISFLGKNFYQGVTNFSIFPKDTRFEELRQENRNLLNKLVQYKLIENENKALKDQFENSKTLDLDLLPSQIVGFPKESFVIDKGKKDGVKEGQAVIINNIVIGKIVKTSINLSVVDLIDSSSSSFTGKDIETQALGVIKGQGDGSLIFDNVLLSENIKESDIVVTKGDMDINGAGFPPDLIIGKITSIDKKPSALFQSAKIKSLIDFSKLSTVFVVLGIK